MTGTNDRDLDDLGNQDDQEDEVEVVDKESSLSLDEWLDKNNPEHLAHTATLYKFLNPVGTAREQKHRWRGEPIPETHDLGIMFGGGRYYMVTVVPPGKKQKKKVYIKRFQLGAEYDALKRKYDEAESAKARALVPFGQSSLPQSQFDNFKVSFEMFNGMMDRVISMFSPLIERALAPQATAPQKSIADELGAYATLKNVMKQNALDNMAFFSDMQRKLSNMNPEDFAANFDQAPEPEQKSILEKLFGMLEPFIPMFIQNSAQAKLASAGLRALPQVNQVIKEVTARPDVVKHLAAQISGKYGKQEAVNFLANAGMKQEEISHYIAPAAPNAARRPAVQSGKKATAKKG